MSKDEDSVCLFGAKIGLECLLRQHDTLAWSLEESIESRLDNSVTDAPVVHINDRRDAQWLHCRKPGIPPQTILGLWEESVDPNEEEAPMESPSAVLDIYQSSVSECHEHECSCVAPHSEWTRKQLVPVSKDKSLKQPLHVKWVDIRQWQKAQGKNNKLLEHPASLCHFTRSLLNCSHSASPWVKTEMEREPDVVALVMMRRYPQALEGFRIGDASPSYFLNSTSQLKLVRDNANWMVSGSSLPDGRAETEEATLLVFRRLPPRDHLSVQHPLDKEVYQSGDQDALIPLGCLWESYQLKLEDDEEEAAEPETFHRLLGPPYVSHRQDYPGLLEPLLSRSNFEAIRSEALSIPQWTAWPEKVHYASEDGPATWTVFPLCHCFPADIAENRKWIESTCAFVPKTTALLKSGLGTTLRTALFSRLNPQATLEPHTGWKDLANHVFRIHLPLVVPPGGLCGTWVDGCVETHEEGRFICFDDAKVHRAFNYSSQDRVVLILDLARPETLPAGTATGGHTDELDRFIQQLS